jgi:hypothetical protein
MSDTKELETIIEFAKQHGGNLQYALQAADELNKLCTDLDDACMLLKDTCDRVDELIKDPLQFMPPPILARDFLASHPIDKQRKIKCLAKE